MVLAPKRWDDLLQEHGLIVDRVDALHTPADEPSRHEQPACAGRRHGRNPVEVTVGQCLQGLGREAEEGTTHSTMPRADDVADVPPDAGVPRVSGRATWQRSCMPIMVTRATGSIGSAVVRRPRAEGAHNLLGLARRLPGGSGSRGADRCSVGLSAESCHGTPATPAACSEPSPGPASRGCSTWSRPAPAHRSRTTARSKSPGPPRAPDSWYGPHESPAGCLLHQHDASGTGSLFTRLRPVVVGRGATGIALLRCVPAKALGMLPVLPMDRGPTIQLVHTQHIAEAIATVLHQCSDGPSNLPPTRP